MCREQRVRLCSVMIGQFWLLPCCKKTNISALLAAIWQHVSLFTFGNGAFDSPFLSILPGAPRGREDVFFHFWVVSVIYFSLIEFHLFPCLLKYYYIRFVIFVFRIGSDKPSGLLFLSCPLYFFLVLRPRFLRSSVSLSYFILAVPMRECLRKHSCMSARFPIAILNGTCVF